MQNTGCAEAATLQEPYLVALHHLENLQQFAAELAATTQIRRLTVITHQRSRRQEANLQVLITQAPIEIQLAYQPDLHAREFVASNGHVVVCDRGIDVYSRPHRSQRRTRLCKVHYYELTQNEALRTQQPQQPAVSARAPLRQHQEFPDACPQTPAPQPTRSRALTPEPEPRSKPRHREQQQECLEHEERPKTPAPQPTRSRAVTPEFEQRSQPRHREQQRESPTPPAEVCRPIACTRTGTCGDAFLTAVGSNFPCGARVFLAPADSAEECEMMADFADAPPPPLAAGTVCGQPKRAPDFECICEVQVPVMWDHHSYGDHGYEAVGWELIFREKQQAAQWCHSDALARHADILTGWGTPELICKCATQYAGLAGDK